MVEKLVNRGAKKKGFGVGLLRALLGRDFTEYASSFSLSFFTCKERIQHLPHKFCFVSFLIIKSHKSLSA